VEIQVKTLVNVVFALIATSTLAFAQGMAPTGDSGTKPTDESLRELLEITHAKRLLEAVPGQIDSMMTTTVKSLLQGRTLSAQEQKSVDAMRAKVATLTAEQLSWEVMEPQYLRIYRDSFSQSEIDGMLAFYKSPAGQAVVEKLPLLQQNIMSNMQQRMAVLLPQIQQMAKETAAKIKAQNDAGQKKTG
jgi:hypothetical protein